MSLLLRPLCAESGFGGNILVLLCIRTANERDNMMSLSVFVLFFAAGRIIYCSFYVEMPGNVQETQIIFDIGMMYAFGEWAEWVRSFDM